MSPTSPALSPPPPRPRPNHNCSPVCFWKRGKAFHLLLGKPPSSSLRRRPCWAAALIGPRRDMAVDCNPSCLPHAGLWCRRHLARRETHTHTTHPAQPAPQASDECLLEASITREHDIRPRSRTAFLHRKGRQPVTALAWLLPWFHRASSAAGLIPANTEVCVISQRSSLVHFPLTPSAGNQPNEPPPSNLT